MRNKVLLVVSLVLLLTSFVSAQKAEVTVSLNEPFFDAVIDSIFKNLKQPDFKLSENRNGKEVEAKIITAKYSADQACDEYVRLEREMDGVRTAVKFRDGKITAPLAFTGTYSVPLMGCMEFQGWAQTSINLEFNREQQVLLGRVKVESVQLGSVANLAGGLIARYVQGSIDKKINPVEILKTDKLNFIVPVKNADGALRLNAKGMRHDVGEGVLNVHIEVEFAKAE